LKEKRVSLRSFLRRGLVILSLFTLAFAFAACSDSDDGGTTPTDPITPTQPPQPYAISLNILTQPVNASFQGLPPDLTGLTVEVVFSDLSKVILRGGEGEDPRWYNLITAPGYCDTAYYNDSSATATGDSNSDPSTYGQGGFNGKQAHQLALGYKGSAAFSDELEIPMVVPASRLAVTQRNAGPVNWYSDARPDFSRLAYNVEFDEGWLGLGTKSVAGKPNTFIKTDEMPMVASYPNVDYGPLFDGSLKRTKKAVVYIGADATSPWTNNRKSTGTVNISNYYEIMGITANNTPTGQYFDDDINRFFKVDGEGKAQRDANNVPEADVQKIYDLFVAGGVTFKVTYEGDGGDKTISMKEFVDNSNWYRRQQNKDPTSTYINELVLGNDGIDARGIYETLRLGEDADDETIWSVYLDYAPLAYSQQFGTTGVQVRVPIYSFANALSVEQRYPGTPYPEITTNIGDIDPTDSGAGKARAMTDRELDGLKRVWKLLGEYEGPGGTAQKEITLTKDLFYAGYFGSSVVLDTTKKNAWSSMNPWDSKVMKNTNYYISKTKTWYDDNYQADDYSINNAVLGAVFMPDMAFYKKAWNYSGNFNKNTSAQAWDRIRSFPLPVYYRGAYLQDDTGILVDVIAKP
jgi:hypothetical protein